MTGPVFLELVGLKKTEMAKSMIKKCGESDPGGRPFRQDPARGGRYCCGMPAALITRAQRAISARMNCANSSRLIGAASITISLKRCWISGMRRTVGEIGMDLVEDRRRRRRPARTVRTRWSLRNRAARSRPGSALRAAAKALQARHRERAHAPGLDRGSTAGAVCMVDGIWPPITSESACGAPL